MTIIPEMPSPMDLATDAKVYVASPIPTFGTLHYRRMRQFVRSHFRDADLVFAEGFFANTDDWLRRWPAVLASLSGLVFFAELDGMLGMGVCKERRDAEAAGLPVWYVDVLGGLHASGRLQLVPVHPQTPRRFARVEVKPRRVRVGVGHG